MNTLRVVIVRPDGTVEANRFIDLKAAIMQHNVAEPFPVVANEKKRIYLFVNEATTAFNQKTNLSRKLLPHNLDNEIKVKAKSPDIEDWTVNLEENTEQIMGPLPMSEKFEIFVDYEPQQSCSLFVTRGAVKFSFRIINQSGNSIAIDDIKINRMARKEWYMPRAQYALNGSGKLNVIEYDVPVEPGYYVFPIARVRTSETSANATLISKLTRSVC